MFISFCFYCGGAEIKDTDTNAVMKNKWLSAIPRKNWTITENTRVCSKHFEKKNFKESSTDERVKRRQARETPQLHIPSLKPSAIPQH